jgi:leucyl/phenylalanyl-tRNA--protein transferase
VRHLRGAVGEPPVPWQFDKYALLETLRLKSSTSDS